MLLNLRSSAILLLVTVAFGVFGSAQGAGRRISGTIVDASGAAVPNALVQLTANGATLQTHTDAQGAFSFENASLANDSVLSVSAPGFKTYSQQISGAEGLRITLELASANTVVNVSAVSRGGELPLSDTPESISVASTALLQVQPSEALDEKLRLLPGFATFRRANSRSANPTTQGVSLRGIGSSGASRALVLNNGMPLNDPFGGWVYWDRVAEAAVSSVEVLRGGASHLYGSGAMGGVVELRPSEARSGIVLNSSFASRNSPFASGLLTHDFGKLGVALSGEGFRTNGYLLPAEQDRGAVDMPASLRYGNGSVRLTYATGRQRFYAGSSFLSETRNNGTQLQRNDTRLFDVTAGAEIAAGPGTFELSGYGSGQRYNQTFSAISLDRNTENLTRVDAVPSQQIGGSALWRGLLRGNNLIFGSDVRHVRGAANGLVIATDRRSVVGGQQRTVGLFVQDRIQLGPRIVASAGLRFDSWRNYEGFNQVLTPVPAERVPLPERTNTAFSPHGALLYRLRDDVSVSASAFGSFRAPTLQELYRGFRVGNVLTQPNPELTAEHLAGAELGISKRWAIATARVSGFWNRVSDPVANITLNVTPQLITRQRQNLGATRSAGLEAESTIQATRWLSLLTSYQLADSVVTSFAADPGLEGKRVPQVPRHSGSISAIASARGWTASAQLRSAGVQFDDDQNLLPLSECASVDLFVSREWHRGVETYLTFENLSTSRYEVARTPLTTFGPPASVSGGIRFSLFR